MTYPNQAGEIRKMAFLIGQWNIVMSVKPDPSADWIETEGNSTFKWTLDKTILHQVYDGSMVGRPFKGIGYLAYNRYSGKWQHTWCDNIAGILSIYEGDYSDDRLAVIGKETINDSGFFVRVIWYNMSADKFDWKLETSSDGNNWNATMKASYRRSSSAE